jgi:chemotaxis protein methyltransferase CheR
MAFPVENRAFSLSEQDSATIRSLIYQRAGIFLSERKHDLIYNRLTKRLRHYGFTEFKQYIDLLSDPESVEWEFFVNALTTNLTSFFREQHHFTYLEDHVRANLMDRTSANPIKIWSAASSTGEEAYSIAITLANIFKTSTPPVKILATDLNTEVLAFAKKGCYKLDDMEKPSHSDRVRYFDLDRENISSFHVKSELKALINFNRLNLLQGKWPMKHSFDIIFCRNVMIYFDKKSQQNLLLRISKILKPGGLLFIGHSENAVGVDHFLKFIKGTTYKRIGERIK